ncbi:MAG: MBL fold metallo-hydrolase [Myxococcales bacterium]
MARLNLRLPENAPGPLFVDSTCIDCDACRQLAPRTFARSDRSGLSYVRRQPERVEKADALVALVACPTASIGGAHGGEVRDAFRSLPLHIHGPVHDLGLRAESSYGATSYLVVREGGNVIVDSPRAAKPLLDRIEQMGGARWNFLTHRDDVADHEQLHQRFGCERVLHRHDVSRRTQSVERQIGGTDPVELSPGLLVIPVPGHTPGSAALLVDDTYLFTGDHLWGEGRSGVPLRRAEAEGRSIGGGRSVGGGSLGMSRSVCWYSWDEQISSLEKLLDFRFRFVLPGHGRRAVARDDREMREWIRKLLREVRYQ